MYKVLVAKETSCKYKCVILEKILETLFLELNIGIVGNRVIIGQRSSYEY